MSDPIVIQGEKPHERVLVFPSRYAPGRFVVIQDVAITSLNEGQARQMILALQKLLAIRQPAHGKIVPFAQEDDRG